MAAAQVDAKPQPVATRPPTQAEERTVERLQRIRTMLKNIDATPAELRGALRKRLEAEEARLTAEALLTEPENPNVIRVSSLQIATGRARIASELAALDKLPEAERETQRQALVLQSAFYDMAVRSHLHSRIREKKQSRTRV